MALAKNALFAIVLWTVVCCAGTAQAATTSGVLAGDEVWSGAVTLTGDVTVPNGVTLTIAAGTTVYFTANADDRAGGANTSLAELIINGSLDAQGTTSSPILFTSTSATPSTGEWYGIRFVPIANNAHMALAGCTVSYAAKGVTAPVDGLVADISIVDSEIHDSGDSGIYIFANNGAIVTLDLDNLDVHDNADYGIYLYGNLTGSKMYGTVNNCRVRDNGDNGIYAYLVSYALGELTITGNQVNDNAGYGVRVYARYTRSIVGQFQVSDNTVYQNNNNGIDFFAYYGYYSAEISNNEVFGCKNGLQLGSNAGGAENLLVEGNKLHNNNNYGLYNYNNNLSLTGPAKLIANEVYANVNNGINFTASQYDTTIASEMILNRVYGNGAIGILISANHPVSMVYNDIYENSTYGIDFKAAQGSRIHYNNIHGNYGVYDLYNRTGNSINARFNYWGASVTTDMETGSNPKNISRLYDVFDNADMGVIAYEPWLDATVAPLSLDPPDNPVSYIISPLHGTLSKSKDISIEGIAVAPSGVSRVEVSPDNGIHWYPAQGATIWSYAWPAPPEGHYTLISRVIDGNNQITASAQAVSVTIDNDAPTSSGTLVADETWSGTVNLTGDVIVPQGITLEILPGTQINFAPVSDSTESGASAFRGELIIEGALIANGTEGNEILFTSASTNKAAGDWYGIRIEPVDNDTQIVMSHCIVEYAVLGISMETRNIVSSLTIQNSTIRYNSDTGIKIRPYSINSNGADTVINLLLENNKIYDNGAHGIYLYSGYVKGYIYGTVIDNQVYQNGAHGIFMEIPGAGTKEVDFIGNIVHGNTEHGINIDITCSASGATYIESNVSGNTVYDNAEGIYVNNQGRPVKISILGNTVSGSSGGSGIYIQKHWENLFDVLVAGNEVFDNAYGIQLLRSSENTFYVRVVGNNVYQNTVSGIFANGYSSTYSPTGYQPLFFYNSIHDNTGKGLHLQYTDKINANYNNFYGNAEEDIYNQGPHAVDARYCYWGAATTAAMDAAGNMTDIPEIHDIIDDRALGRVAYDQWQESEIGLPQAPVSGIITPYPNAQVPDGALTITGVAYAPDGVGQVLVSIDGGAAWQAAESDTLYGGYILWHHTVDPIAGGSYAIISKAVDANGMEETDTSPVAVTVNEASLTTSGTLTRDQVWSGTVTLTGDVTIPEGVTLYIQAGTTVKAVALSDDTFGGRNDSRVEIRVAGTLIADGETGQAVVFTSDRGTTAEKDDWGGIDAWGTVTLRHAQVEYAQSGIIWIPDEDGDNLYIDNSTISNCSQDGLSLQTQYAVNPSATITNSSISGNDRDGIYIYRRYILNSSLTLDISHNTITDNGDSGIYDRYVKNYVAPTIILNADIRSNTITGHPNYNIYSDAYLGVSHLKIQGNTIDQGGNGIYLRYNQNSVESTLTISGNTVQNCQVGIDINAYNVPFYPQIINNTIQNNAQHGIKAVGTGTYTERPFVPYFESNRIIGNAGYGIYLEDRGWGQAVLRYNTLYGNSTRDFYNYGAMDVDAQYNWWGDATTAEMDAAAYPANISAIYDYYDNTARGIVEYANWLAAGELPATPSNIVFVTPTNVATQTISGDKDPDTAVFINGVEAVPSDGLATWSHELSLGEGANRFTIHARNAANMISASETVTIMLDTTPPAIFRSSPANGTIVTSIVEAVTINLQEEGTQVDPTATVNGATAVDDQGAAIPGQWSVNNHLVQFTPDQPLGEGGYTLTFNPTDTLGNTQPAAITFGIDITAPTELTVNGLPSEPTQTATHTLTGTKDPDSGVWMNDTLIVPIDDESEWSYALTLAEGLNALAFTARDAAGLQSPVVQRSVILDTVMPVFVSVDPANGTYINVTPAGVSFKYRDTTTSLDRDRTLNSGVLAITRDYVALTDAGTWDVVGNTIVFTPSPGSPWSTGTYRLTVKAYDLAGNYTANNTFAFIFDNTAPENPPTVTSEVPDSTGNMLLDLTGTRESYASVWINGVMAVGNTYGSTWSYTYTLSQGTNIIEIHQQDRAGNISPSLYLSVDYDETAPLPVNTLSVDAVREGTSAALNWQGYDESGQGDVDLYEIYASQTLFTQADTSTYIDTVAAGTFSYVVNGLDRNQQYYFAVIAVDDKENKNLSVTPVGAQTRDIQPPEEITNFQVTSGETSVFFSWYHPMEAAGGDLAGYRVYFNGEATPTELIPTEISYARNGLSPATGYPVRITALDYDGNESDGFVQTVATWLPNPANVTAATASGTITLSWDGVVPSNLVETYHVYYATADFSSIETMQPPEKTTTNTTITIGGLQNGTEYFLAVTAVNISGAEQSLVTTVSATPSSDNTGPQLSNILIDGRELQEGSLLLKDSVITLTADDPAGVQWVRFTFDRTLINVDSSRPYSAAINFYQLELTDGEYPITIDARDGLGNDTQMVFNVIVKIPPEVECIDQCVDN